MDSYAQAYEVRDSLGVVLVTSGPDGSGQSEGWTIVPEPILTIGQLDGDDPYLFTRVWDALRTADGQLVVVEATVHEIRVFDREGHHEATFGGQGGGPQEFGGAPWISLAAPDTLVVWDPGHYRLSRYGLTGELLDQITLRDAFQAESIRPFRNGLVWETAADGSVLWTGPTLPSGRSEGLTKSFKRLVLLRPNKAHDFGTYPAGEMFWIRLNQGGLRGIANVFAPSTTQALRSDGLVAVSDAERFEIKLYRPDGTLIARHVGILGRTPVTDEMEKLARAKLPDLSDGLGVPLRTLERAHGRIPMPDSVPAIARLLWDTTGNLWVGQRAGDIWTISEYHVFDEDGRWLASLDVPPGIGRIFEVGEDYLLATGQDRYDVQYLNMYRLEKPGG